MRKSCTLQELTGIEKSSQMYVGQQDITCSMENKSERRFFDLKTEYLTVRGNSDDDEDEMSDDVTAGVHGNEDGYSSDISNASTRFQDQHQWKESRKNRKTRQVLDSKRSSLIVDYASDTDVPIVEKQQRKRKVKNNRWSRQLVVDSKEMLTTKNVEENSQKRRSWTDSGVSLSLSRTDQSRCGTFENGISANPQKQTDNDKHGEDAQIKNTKKLLKPEDPEVICNNDENKNDEISNSVPLRRRSSTGSPTECKHMNRLSQITNRSSLTNVTVLTSNSMSSLSSMITPSEMEYVTSDILDEDDDDDGVTSSAVSTAPRQTEIVKGSHSSVASDCTVVSGLENNMSSLETTATTDLSNDQANNNHSCHEKVQTFDTKPKSTKIISAKSHIDSNRKRSKSLLSSFKRVKEQLRPRFLSDKHYKDVSSEFSFEKIHSNDKENESIFDHVTHDVLKKLEKLEQLHEAECAEQLDDIPSNFVDYDSVDEDESGNDLLEKLSSPPVKEKGFFLGKIFKRSSSKSYSTTNIEKKNKTPNPAHFNRTSGSRASVRSNPEHVTCNKYEDSTYYEEDLDYSCNDSYCECDQDMSRARSMNYIDEEFYYLKKRSNSTPTTPSVVRNVQGLNSIENQCSCDECLYADYLDFLEFQRFRRYANYTPYVLSSGPHELMTSHGAVCRNNNEQIVAPLTVTVETDKQAKTFRTSKYESFV